MKKLFLLMAITLFLSGCADQVSFIEAATHQEVGFWYGLWHGLILPFSWIISLFDKDVAVYAIYNNGGWYDFGFLLGAASIFGGGTKSGRLARR